MSHDVDPHHLTTTSLSGMDPAGVRLVQERAPDLDVLSVQMYAEIEILPERIAASGWDGPILVTEWGATGYWEVQKTSWGAPIENDSSTKADFYGSRYEPSIASQRAQVIGHRGGLAPDHADGALGRRRRKAGDVHTRRPRLAPHGHLGDQGHAQPRADHLHQRRQCAAVQPLARRPHIAERQRLIAETVPFFQ